MKSINIKFLFIHGFLGAEKKGRQCQGFKANMDDVQNIPCAETIRMREAVGYFFFMILQRYSFIKFLIYKGLEKLLTRVSGHTCLSLVFNH